MRSSHWRRHLGEALVKINVERHYLRWDDDHDRSAAFIRC
ncbi:hypothetical protein ABIE63_001270 [Limibacillus sp. MBR-115]